MFLSLSGDFQSIANVVVLESEICRELSFDFDLSTYDHFYADRNCLSAL